MTDLESHRIARRPSAGELETAAKLSPLLPETAKLQHPSTERATCSCRVILCVLIFTHLLRHRHPPGSFQHVIIDVDHVTLQLLTENPSDRGLPAARVTEQEDRLTKQETYWVEYGSFPCIPGTRIHSI